jgi:hypothetical protein
MHMRSLVRACRMEFERHDKANCSDLPLAFLLFIAMVKHDRYCIYRMSTPAGYSNQNLKGHLGLKEQSAQDPNNGTLVKPKTR